MIAGGARVVRHVALFWGVGDVEVGDGDELESGCTDVADQLFQVRKCLGVGGEGTVAVLIIDVQPNHVGRNPVLAEPRGD